MKAVLLAGGKGTRLAPYTTVLPKPLIPVGEMPILEILIRQLKRSDFREIILSVGYLRGLLEAYFGDGSKWGIDISYSREEMPLGTAGPLVLIPDLTETFLLMNGDLLTTLDYTAMVQFHRESAAIATVGLFRKQVNVDLGVIKVRDDNYIVDYIEKPTFDYEVSMGIYVMEPEILQYIPYGEHFDLPDLIKILIADRQPVIGYHFDGYWLDIGRKDDYDLAVEMFEEGKIGFLPSEEING